MRRKEKLHATACDGLIQYNVLVQVNLATDCKICLYTRLCRRDICLMCDCSYWPSPAVVSPSDWLLLVCCRHFGWKQKAFIKVSGDTALGQQKSPHHHQQQYQRRHPMKHQPVLTIPKVVSGHLVGYTLYRVYIVVYHLHVSTNQYLRRYGICYQAY